MNPYHEEHLKSVTRRHFFKSMGLGIGALGLTSILNPDLFKTACLAGDAANPMAPRPPHYQPKAKNVIFLFMAGAPSQIDLFDPKPKLTELNGTKIPESFIKDERFAFIKGVPELLGSPHTFKQYGKTGAWVSNLLPHTAGVVDDLAIIKSMHTTQFNHAPAQIFMNTGHNIFGRPSMGSWLTYGLGSECTDLPGFVVLLSGNNNPDGGKACWGSGFLPTYYQGVEFRNKGEPVLYVGNPPGVDDLTRRQGLDVLKELNKQHFAEIGDPEIVTRIESYEMSYKMQKSVPDLSDISKETKATQEMYGIEPGKASFGNNCLLARRLVERGVRFVQLYHRGWDHHGESDGNSLLKGLPERCKDIDQGCAALIKDLKQRGMLENTIVVWGGEFGRTPMNEKRDGSKFLGRDHHPKAFTMWMAGGGIKPGVYGATDEIGYKVVEDPIEVHDLHATIMHQMGLDHTKLTYRFQGRDFRLTDVFGHVVKKLV